MTQAGSGMLGGSEMMHGHGGHGISSIGGHGELGMSLSSQCDECGVACESIIIYLIVVAEM